MDRYRINSLLCKETAEELGINHAVVRKVVDQYFEAIKKIFNTLDFSDMTKEEFYGRMHMGFYLPNIGKFVYNWKIIENWQKSKYNKKKNRDAED